MVLVFAQMALVLVDFNLGVRGLGREEGAREEAGANHEEEGHHEMAWT